MTAMAASLVGVVGVREYQYQQMPTQFVAVLQAGEDRPAFLMTVDTNTHKYVITAVAAPKKAEKSYEVWMVHDKMPKLMRRIKTAAFCGLESVQEDVGDFVTPA